MPKLYGTKTDAEVTKMLQEVNQVVKDINAAMVADTKLEDAKPTSFTNVPMGIGKPGDSGEPKKPFGIMFAAKGTASNGKTPAAVGTGTADDTNAATVTFYVGDTSSDTGANAKACIQIAFGKADPAGTKADGIGSSLSEATKIKIYANANKDEACKALQKRTTGLHGGKGDGKASFKITDLKASGLLN